MNGQWLGHYTGSIDGVEGEINGRVVVNVDELPIAFEVIAYAISDNNTLPLPVAYFNTPNKERTFQCRTGLMATVDGTAGVLAPWAQVADRFPGVLFPEYADISGTWNEHTLTVEWVTNIGSRGHATLPRSAATTPSNLQAKPLTWEDFKQHVGGLPHRHFLFRGQNTTKRLRTSFHRRGRAHIHRFITQDIPALYRHLSARTKHVFNINNNEENGAFFNLIQHHGYPTPLLDWTYSPYVAAFFAYRNVNLANPKQEEKVRILLFDAPAWKLHWNQSGYLLVPPVHFSVMEFSAIENERMIPQQAASTLTNIDDIESYIHEKEEEKGVQYLTAIDLPATDRKRVMRDLSTMGITAGSLFPGLDGACEELKERFFES